MVSLIIPVYNVESYLRECMDSVCNQTLENIEIICIDDGSTDASGAILDEYASKDSRITVIHSSNKGLSSARNLGLQHAHCEYISFLDSDDYIAPTMCEVLYNAIVEHNVDIAMCGISVVYEEGQERRTAEEAYYIDTKSGLYPIDIDIIEHTIVVVYAKILKKSLLDKYDIRFLEGKVYEDNYFTRAYLSIASTMYVINEQLLFRRIRKNSITEISLRGYNAQHIDALHQYAHLFSFWKKQGLLDTTAELFWRLYLSTIWLIARTLRYRYFHILFNVAGSFIEANQHTIPNVEYFIPYKNMLLEYIGYKDMTIRDIATLLRTKRREEHIA